MRRNFGEVVFCVFDLLFARLAGRKIPKKQNSAIQVINECRYCDGNLLKHSLLSFSPLGLLHCSVLSLSLLTLSLIPIFIILVFIIPYLILFYI